MTRRQNNPPGDEHLLVRINLLGKKPLSLEEQVRAGLIDRRVEELLEAAKLPEYSAIMKESIQVLFDNIVGAVQKKENLDEDETAGLKQEMQSRLMPLLATMLSTPENLRKIMYESAKNEYASAQEWEANLDKQCEQLKLPEALEQEYRKAYEPVFESARKTEKFVARAAEIAKQEGLDKALEKETIYALIRELYPTAQDYMESARKSKESLQKFTMQAQAPLMADGDAGQMAGMGVGAFRAVIENARAKYADLIELNERKKEKEIYGVDYEARR